ncbi:MAG: CDP-alcohol phosphatidyltransferase family protein [Victivallales bacterium]
MKRNFKVLLENNKWLKKVPNLLTICNSLCGFGAMLYTLHVYDNRIIADTYDILAVSAWLILFAMIFDMLDGFAARLFNAASMHGIQMDSLADMVTFGVAPAVIVAVMAHSLRAEMRPFQYFLVWGFCAIYIGCAASRLATYNVHAMLEKKSGEKFSGLPSPGAAAAICSLVIFYASKSGEITQIVLILPFYAAILGILMVSSIPYMHAGRWLMSVRRNKKRLFILFVVLIAMYYSPFLVLVLAVNIYVASGPFTIVARKLGLVPQNAGETQQNNKKS